jgi:Domain of unknown function (DUF4340)
VTLEVEGIMDSPRWVVALALAAMALAALLVIDLVSSREAPTAGARIVPEWDARAIRAVRIERDGAPPVRIERLRPSAAGAGTEKASGSGSETGTGSGAGWGIRIPGRREPVPADPGAVRDLLGTIEILSAIRRDEAALGAPALTLVIERDGAAPIRLLVGGAAPGPTDRVWLARADRSGRFLVDGYAVRALDVDLDDLREHRPFRGRTAAATRIELGPSGGATALSGPPWRVELPGGRAAADPRAVSELLEQLDHLRVDRYLRPPAGAPTRLIAVEARAGRTELAQRGPCPGGAALIDTPAGSGCARLPPALHEPVRDPERLVDRRLVATSIEDVTAIRLERGGRDIAVSRADAPDALRGWLARWRDAAAGPLEPAARLSAPLAAVDIEVEGGARERLTVSRTGDGRLAARRDGEPVALVLHDWADSHLDPSPHRFRPLDLLAVEPSALRAATARRSGRVIEAIERGQTLEEWRAASGAAVPLTAVEPLRQAVGFLRAESFSAPAARPVHGLSPPRRTVELVFDPPPGADKPLRHTIEIGAPAGQNACYARLDRDPTVFELAASRCAALLGPWIASR